MQLHRARFKRWFAESYSYNRTSFISEFLDFHSIEHGQIHHVYGGELIVTRMPPIPTIRVIEDATRS